MLVISISTTFSLHNIFHILGTNVLVVGEHLIKNKIDFIDSMLVVHKVTNPAQIKNCEKCAEWFLYVLSGFVKNIFVLESDTIYCKSNKVKILHKDQIKQMNDNMYLLNHWKLVFDKPIHQSEVLDSDVSTIITKLKSNLNIKTRASKIKYIFRENSRNIIDWKTKEPIQNILVNHGIECASFDNMSVKEQIEYVKDARVLIIGHGAACTNMIFTDDQCVIVELTLDKVWYAEYWLYDYENLAKYLHKRYLRFPIIGLVDLNIDELSFRYGTTELRNSSQEMYSVSEKQRALLFSKTQLIDTSELIKKTLSL
jgi:hypothetical protein